MEEKKLTDEKSMFNYIANDVLGQVKPLYLRKRIVREIFDLIHRLQGENERLKCTKYRASWKAKFFKAQAEIERLTKLVDKWENVYGDDYWLAKHNEILKEILEAVDKESNGQTLSVTNVLRKRYGVEVE